MMTAAATYDWLFWGIALMVGLPVLVVLLGELAEGLARHGLAHMKRPIDALRTSCLILLFVMLLLRQVAGLPGDNLAVKVVDTAFWISVINAVVVLFNVVIFEAGATDWRARAPKLLIDLGRLFLVAFGGALVVSHVWNVDLRGLLAALGVGSLVIGLALQDTLGNVFSGIAMISARQFKVGDWIRVGDVEGQVRSINWRTVAVTALTGDVVIIPNSMIARDRLRVYGADQGWMRIATDLKLAYEHPPERVQEILLKAVAMTKDVLSDPKPTVRLVAYEDFAVLYRVSFALKEFRNIVPLRSEFLANVWYLGEREGLVFPARYNHRFDLPKDVMRPRAVPAHDLAERLRRLGTFQRPPETLSELTANGRLELFRRGETIIAHGQRAPSAYIVASGAAQAIDLHAGKETVVDAYLASDVVVFKAQFRGSAAPLTVRATSDVEVIAIPVNDLEAMLARDAHLAHELEQLMTLREEGSARVLAKTSPGVANGSAENADRMQILKDLFRV